MNANEQRPVGSTEFEPVFPRAHKRALGMAVGLTAGLAILALTAIHVALPVDGLPIGLLSEYFYGYSVSWPGAVVGFFWGFATGFVAGWLLGFVHNFTIGIWLLVIRARRDMAQTRNFLDHI